MAILEKSVRIASSVKPVRSLELGVSGGTLLAVHERVSLIALEANKFALGLGEDRGDVNRLLNLRLFYKSLAVAVPVLYFL